MRFLLNDLPPFTGKCARGLLDTSIHDMLRRQEDMSDIYRRTADLQVSCRRCTGSCITFIVLHVLQAAPAHVEQAMLEPVGGFLLASRLAVGWLLWTTSS